MSSYLELKNISKRFGGVTALRSVDLILEKGEVHCLVGENGCGKSTLIKIISGVLQPESDGHIYIENVEHHGLNPVESTRLGVQVIYQDLSVFPNLTVAENIAIGHHAGRPHLTRNTVLRDTAATAIARIGVDLDPKAIVGDLSIANRQLVAICRALAADARLVIMDEPTASLTRREVDALLKVVSDMRAAGICVVFVSHRIDEVLEIADRVTVIRDGSKVGTYQADDLDDREVVRLMTGKEFNYAPNVPSNETQTVVLAVNQLTRNGEFNDIDLVVRAGEIVGITGLLGAGRTELALTLFGINSPDSGSISMEGCNVRFRSNRDAIGSGIAYVPEDRLNLGLVLQQPISSNLVVSILDRLATAWGVISMSKRSIKVDAMISAFSIKVSNPENAVRTLSGGNQQRVVLSKWLARHPKLLILDSPTVGVDINAKDGIYSEIRKLAAQGVAVVIISDEIPEVLYHSHRIIVMRNGRFVSEHLPAAVSETKLRDAVNA